jgi:DNA polymerase-3 subunit epsilon
VEGTLSLFDWRPTPAAPEVRDEPPAPPAPAVRQPTIIVFDCETTGIDVTRDQVIELCVQHGLDDTAKSQVWRMKPAVPIHPAAQAVHGITMADLADCSPFGAYADEIAQVFAAADVIVGYNLSFDIDMLQAEYTRLGKPLLDLSGKQIVDAFRLWQQCEPRSLQHAHRRFVGEEFASAHSASADVAATGRVLVGMLRHFNLHEQDWSQIARVCDPGRASWVGPSRHLRWENDVIVLGFGKHAGAALHELAAGPDRGFLTWVINKDFPAHVAEICRAALERSGDDFIAWARERFGQAAPTEKPPFAAHAPASASMGPVPARPAAATGEPTPARPARSAGEPTPALAAGSGPVAQPKPRAKKSRSSGPGGARTPVEP